MRWGAIGTLLVRLSQSVGLLLAGVGLVINGIGLIMTVQQHERDATAKSSDIALKIDERLLEPRYQAIIDRVYETDLSKPLLAENKGPIHDIDLEALLGTYDTLYQLRREDLIDARLTFNMFCGELVDVYSNKEVKAYLASMRTAPDSKDADDGFDRLADQCAQWAKRDRVRLER